MKKISFILVVVFALGLLFTSCNKKTCPAYSQQDQEQTDNYEG